jgi:hypothetical protein
MSDLREKLARRFAEVMARQHPEFFWTVVDEGEDPRDPQPPEGSEDGPVMPSQGPDA